MASDVNKKLFNSIHSLRTGDPLRQQAEIVLADSSAKIQNLLPITTAFYKRSILRVSEQTVAFWLINNANWTDNQRATISEKLCGRLDKATKGRRVAVLQRDGAEEQR
jgi:hypothetical protein